MNAYILTFYDNMGNRVEITVHAPSVADALAIANVRHGHTVIFGGLPVNIVAVGLPPEGCRTVND